MSKVRNSSAPIEPVPETRIEGKKEGEHGNRYMVQGPKENSRLPGKAAAIERIFIPVM